MFKEQAQREDWDKKIWSNFVESDSNILWDSLVGQKKQENQFSFMVNV